MAQPGSDGVELLDLATSVQSDAVLSEPDSDAVTLLDLNADSGASLSNSRCMTAEVLLALGSIQHPSWDGGSEAGEVLLELGSESGEAIETVAQETLLTVCSVPPRSKRRRTAAVSSLETTAET